MSRSHPAPPASQPEKNDNDLGVGAADVAQASRREPFVQDADFTLYVGDVREVLAGLPAESVDCCVTSPPYWGLRDYGHDGQIGLEETPEQYVEQMVAVFRAVRRVLSPAGTLWVNLGDSYASDPNKGGSGTPNGRNGRGEDYARGKRIDRGSGRWGGGNGHAPALAPKNLVGVPWRVAFALQADGWYLRSDIIWAKPNPMPESVTDRPTKAHEYVFLLAKSPCYFFDADAVREKAVGPDRGPGMTRGINGPHAEQAGLERRARTTVARRTPLIPNQTKEGVGTQGVGSSSFGHYTEDGGRNARSVWEIPTQPYAEAHFATFPLELPRRCIAAGCPAGGTVLDPFLGSGTTALVARRLGRKSVGVELNPDYARLAARRLQQLSLLAEAVA